VKGNDLPVLFLVGAILGPVLAGQVQSQQFQPATNLAPTVNTPLTEKAQYITSDGDTLYFVHPSPMGDMNIFVTAWNGSSWEEAVDIGSPPNSPFDEWGPL